MAGPTPGPWFADGYKVWGRRAAVSEGGYLSPRYSYKVADATLHHPWEYEEQQANTRLIAAAPELLEALKATLPLLEDWHDDDGRASPAWREATQAIAKAEGVL